MNLLVDILDCVGFAGAVSCALPSLVLLVECVAAAAPLTRDTPTENSARVESVAVLIPAHDESASITQTIVALAPQLKPQDRMIVIADNCNDTTAELARVAGAEVVVRQNATCRGKGYALAAGVEHLRASGVSPEVVLILDADCRLSNNAVDLLVARVRLTQRPVQGSYEMVVAPSAGVQARISAFAFLVKCHVRSLGRERFGWPCHLMGTGMAFPWAHLVNAELANGNIVEDMALGVDLILANRAPVFEPRVQVISAAAEGRTAAVAQRRRWEHGHLQTIQKYVPRLLLKSLRQRSVDAFVMACDLAVPPLALLSIFWLLAQLFTVAIIPLGGSHVPVLICSAAGVALMLAVLLAWRRFGRAMLPFTTLLMVPLYICSKLPIYAGFAFGKRSGWVRTARAGESV